MTSILIRHPAIAGRFYPGESTALRAEVQSFISPAKGKRPVCAVGCIVPHAGYVYSGHVAGAVFAKLEIPELCIILCPNHTGMGRPLAIMSEGIWETPLGSVSIDENFAANLKQRLPTLEEDSAAHRAEHAIEVELPFLQTLRPGIKFVPIALGTRHFETLHQLGIALADAIAAYHGPALIVASSDM